MGVKIFYEPEEMKDTGGGNFDGPAPWEAFFKLGKDGITVQFIFLNDLTDNTEPEDRLVQWMQYTNVKGKNRNGDDWYYTIPCGDNDPPNLIETMMNETQSGDRQIGKQYQYASNVFIIKAFRTDDRQKEVELWGDDVDTPWKDKPLSERVRLLRNGKDTSNSVVLQYERWKEDDEGLPGHVCEISRIKTANRTAYEFGFVKSIPKNAKIKIPELNDNGEEIDGKYKSVALSDAHDELGPWKHNIIELLDWERTHGLKGYGVIPWGGDSDKKSSDDNQKTETLKDEGNLSVEGDEGSDDLLS